MNPTRIFESLLTPVKKFPTSFFFLSFILWLPEIFAVDTIHLLKNIVRGGGGGNSFSFPAWLSLFFLLSYGLGRKNEKLGSFFIAVLHILCYFIFFTECFLFAFFDSHINANILQVIEETNRRESSEFLQTYLLTAKFFGICLFTFTLAGLEFALHQVFKKRIFKFSKKLDRILAVCLLISFAILVYNSSFFSLEFREDWKKVEKKFITLKHTTIFNWYESFSQYLQERNSFLLSAKVNENIHASAVSSHPQNIIVIIGESFIKHHSSLYGYHLETNPKLASLENLYVFDNVISPINATSDAFKNFLSLSSIDEQKEWYDSPLFPAVFKAAGYNVIFFSNQFVKAAQMSTHDASCGFFNHPSLSLNLFNHRNSEKYEFDENLLDFYKSVRNEIESDSLNLILLHLYGQHVRYSGRFPKEREHFKIADYANRTELSESEKQEVADYDNATLYNDSIVYEIITMYDSTNAVVVYFSDHGDEVNDYRPHIGRSRNLDVIGAPGLHCQLDIPFLIHISPSYKHLHPGAAERINAAVHKPFIIDDLPHVLMDLAKINYDLYQPQRSLVNSMFNENRKRIVRPLASQQIDYDSVCTKYGKWKMGYERK